MKRNHLVILKKQYLDLILQGKKTIESRLLKTKHPPLGQINLGDKLFLKQSSGPVCATAMVKAVKTYENLTPQKIAELKNLYNNKVLGADEYWNWKQNSKFAIFAWLENVKQIPPVYIDKKDWRAWVVLTEKQNFGLLSHQPK